MPSCKAFSSALAGRNVDFAALFKLLIVYIGVSTSSIVPLIKESSVPFLSNVKFLIDTLFVSQESQFLKKQKALSFRIFSKLFVLNPNDAAPVRPKKFCICWFGKNASSNLEREVSVLSEAYKACIVVC